MVAGFLGFVIVCGLTEAQDSVPLQPPLDPTVPAPVQAPVFEPDGEAKLPSVDAIAEQISAVKNSATLEETVRDQIVDVLTKTQANVAQAIAARQEKETFTAQTESAGKRLNAVRQQLKSPPTIETEVDTWSSLEQVQNAQAKLEAELQSAQEELEAIVSEARSRKEETQQLPKRLVESEKKLEQLQGLPPIAEDVAPELRQATEQERRTAIAQTRSEIAMIRQKIARNEAEAELLPAQQRMVEDRIEAIQAELQRSTQLLAKQRTLEIRNTVAGFERLIAGTSPEYREFFAEAKPQLQQWEIVVDRASKAQARLIETRGSLASLKQELETTEGLVNADRQTGSGLSRSVGYFLQREQANLPVDASLQRKRSQLSAEVDAAQAIVTQIDGRLKELRRFRANTPADEEALRAERELFAQMKADLDDYVSDLVKTGVEHNQYADVVGKYRQLINRHLLWVRSAAPFQIRDIESFDEAAAWLLGVRHWRRLGSALLQMPMRHPVPVFVWAGLLSVLVYGRKNLKQRLFAAGQEASHRLATRLRPTVQTLLWSVLLALPMPLALGGIGYLTQQSDAEDDFLMAVGRSLLIVAAVAMPLEFLRQVMRPGGLAHMHFDWPKSATRSIQTALYWMIHAVLPVLFFWRLLTEAQESIADLQPLARLLFVTAMLIVSALMAFLTHPRRGAAAGYLAHRTSGWIAQLWWFWRPLLILIPLALAILSLAGYGYSASQLAFRLYRTVWIITLAAILGGLASRWLLLSQRRIAIQQMRKRAAERAAEKTAANDAPQLQGVEIVDVEPVDVEEISAQSQRLIRAGLFVVVLLGLYNAWGPVLPALQFLDSVKLWPITDEAGNTIEQITLSNLVLAIPIVALTIIIVRNVPGLLETVILQRLPLENAARYAITTLSSYLLATLGIVLTARVLGIHWSSVQWLIAGLGVGLGFGLQEIFANFISGIILLFEQPIRVGDVVTLEGDTGTVTKIRMRATTITNWDRQELVVPNKNLITGTLVNWSLSDSVTRVTIRVGVAYGSDTERVCQVLRDILHTQPILSRDLDHLITFEEFGDSTLNFTIRCYLPGLENRLGAIHDLHMEIDRRFRAEGIEIAFPQRDLHVRSVPEGWSQPDSKTS